MSHLNTTDSPTGKDEANYTAVEMTNRTDTSSTDSQASNKKGFKLVLATIERHWAQNGKVKLIITALGIFVSYLFVGFLQEKIMRGCYSNEDQQCDKFTFAFTLVLVQFVFSYIFIKGMDLIKPEGKDSTHPGFYACAAAANVAAMVSSNKALIWITYPMQVIFKSAKPISVMIGGLFFCKRYTLRRYFFVLIIVIGVALFKYFENKDGKKKKETSKTGETVANDYHHLLGIGLLILSLTMDGILGGIQDKIRDRYSPSSRQFMIAMSFWGTVILLILSFVTGEIFDAYYFTLRHPNVLVHLASFATAGVIGQLFIFTMVSSFGSLPCSITTTVRKFFSVLFSILFFGNPSTPLQWLGATFVFAGLLADAIYGKKRTPQSDEKQPEEEAENTEELVDNPEEKVTIMKSNNTQSEGQQVV